MSPAFATRVRVNVHPALSWSVFDATNSTCTECAIGLFAIATCTPFRKKVRQLHARQNSGCTFPFAHAHNSDTRHSRKYDKARPNHMIDLYHACDYCLPWAKMAQVSGNLTCVDFCEAPCARSIPFPTATIMQCEVGSSHP